MDVLTNGGDIRLATLIAQTPGDEEFRADVREQLRIWKDDQLDGMMKVDIRKLYALAAGEVDVLEGSSRKEDIDMTTGLDWLRVFGLQLWFSSFLDTPLRETFETYEAFIKASSRSVASPAPWYMAHPTHGASDVFDGIFNLMKLALSSSTLESALNPIGFSPNPRDYKLPWFIYVLLSRCLRTRDFSDRQYSVVAEEDDSFESAEEDGYSATADSLTINFASQLEQEGSLQEAAFVLLFIEEDDG